MQPETSKFGSLCDSVSQPKFTIVFI